MASDSTPSPAYGEEQNLPPYIDDIDGASAPSRTDVKSNVAQKLWFQSIDISGMYRRRLILPADPIAPPPEAYLAGSLSTPPPNYTETRTPLYTVKIHSAHSSISPRGSMSAKALQQPDFTIYVGEGDEGPVVAVGMIHSNKLQRGIGAVRFFPRSSSNDGIGESSSSATERLSIIIAESGDKKHVFELDRRELEWEEIGPGEQREEEPAPPPPPPVVKAEPKGNGFFSKLKSKIGSPPKTPPTAQPPKETVTLQLSCTDPNTGVRTNVATYTELQPIASKEFLYRHVPPAYKDGHCGALDIHDPFFTFLGASKDAARDLAVVTLSLIFENARREIGRNKNRNWLSAGGMVANAAM